MQTSYRCLVLLVQMLRLKIFLKTKKQKGNTEEQDRRNREKKTCEFEGLLRG